MPPIKPLAESRGQGVGTGYRLRCRYRMPGTRQHPCVLHAGFKVAGVCYHSSCNE